MCASSALGYNPLAAEKLAWLADKYVANQTADGKINPAWDPNPKDYPHAFISMEMYKAYDATGNAAYKTAADKYYSYYLGIINDANVTPARHGIALAGWADYKRCNPGSTTYDARMDGMYNYMMDYRWSQPSYFRCGYTDPYGMDVAFSNDLGLVGDGLVSYYKLTHNPAALQAAEGLAHYFLTEMVPGTYQGVWSSTIGTWAVGPSGVTNWEHHLNTPVSTVGWGTGAQQTTDYLIQLHALTSDASLKQAIREKCVESMKWQFDECQFSNGALGMCGRDDWWFGMTAGAVQTFLWNYDAGFLSPTDISQYQPKALAATDWILGHLTDNMLNRAGYYPLTGESLLEPKSHGIFYTAWAMEVLIRYDDLVAIPEPSALLLLATGVVGLLIYVRCRSFRGSACRVG
ncbi:MAG: PEP-CTERM sorting domain-containing protein [Pirellulaceae bacterium]|nr:PEP-CTERM sorting domain-containing protein [Pirellulaceae bacterium]